MCMKRTIEVFWTVNTTKEQFFRNSKKTGQIFGQFLHILPPNFCKRANNLNCPEMLVPVKLQRICNNHQYPNFYTYDIPSKGRFFQHYQFQASLTPQRWRHSKNLMRYSTAVWKFDVNFKNLVGNAVSMFNRIGHICAIQIRHGEAIQWCIVYLGATKTRGWRFA